MLRTTTPTHNRTRDNVTLEFQMMGVTMEALNELYNESDSSGKIVVGFIFGLMVEVDASYNVVRVARGSVYAFSQALPAVYWHSGLV